MDVFTSLGSGALYLNSNTYFSFSCSLYLQTSDTRLLFSDIDECATSDHGGCSHKCINTAGGYRCACPDPELSLEPDNKTCRGEYVVVQFYPWFKFLFPLFWLW